MDPVNCPVGAVLEFLQERFSAGLSHSTLKVYVGALSAFHVPLSGSSLGRHPFISRFLCGTLRLRPAVCTRVPTWDLAIVLEGLSLAPFEPIEEVSEKFITLKTIFLLAIFLEENWGYSSSLGFSLVLGIFARHGKGFPPSKTGLCS